MSDLAAGLTSGNLSPVEKFREFLSTRKSRLTAEREFILDAVFSSHEHFDREQLVIRLTSQQDGKRVSRASVYRCVDLLEEAGLIRRVARHNEREVYEHDYGYPQHDHLICSKCGTLTEFKNNEISEILERISGDFGFRMDSHRLEVYGTCKECSRPAQRNHKLGMI